MIIKAIKDFKILYVPCNGLVWHICRGFVKNKSFTFNDKKCCMWACYEYRLQ